MIMRSLRRMGTLNEFLLQAKISYLGEIIKLFESNYLQHEDRGQVVGRINLLCGSIEQDLGLEDAEEKGEDDAEERG